MAKINEKQIDLLTRRLIERIDKANTYFLMSIGKSIKQIKKLTPTQAHQLVQMLKYGGRYEEILAEMSRYTNMNYKDIEDIFREYAKKDQQFYKQFYEYREKPFVEYDKNPRLQQQVEAYTRIAQQDLYNYTRSNVLGYMIRDTKGILQFTGLRETFNRVLDEAVLNISQGKETFDTAMYRMLKDIGGNGLKTIEYKSGRTMRLDSAVRMHMQGRLRELHNETQLIYGEEFDADGVEISVHANPAPDHADAQGRQFDLEQYELLQTTGVATDYTGEEVNIHGITKKGYTAGFRPISEYNCYHYVFSVVLGVSKPDYTKEELQQIVDSNDMGFELDGKHYTNYEGTQMQRQLETKIREQKDIQILAKSSDNKELIAEAQTKISQYTQKYKELSQVSGLSTQMERMRVSGYTLKGRKRMNHEEIKYARKNNVIWHSTENLEDIIRSDKIISPSIAVGKQINNKVKYGTQFIEFKPELLENVNKNTILYKDDGGNVFSGRNSEFKNLTEMLKDSPKYYNELKFNTDLESLKYIKKVYIRQDEPKAIIDLLKANNIDYEIYYDYRIRGFKKKK